MRAPPDLAFARLFTSFEGGEIAQTVTFRLFDSLPQSLLAEWRNELDKLPARESNMELRKRIEAHLDRGEGLAWMKNPDVANVIQDALLFFDSERYHLQAWVVMPNHVHALLTPIKDWELGAILHAWKSFTANECNKVLGLRGNFWQPDFFDRYVRDERHYHNAITYIHDNPVKAGLCKKPEDWKWSSARLVAGSAR